MVKLACHDYGYECEFVAQGDDADKIIEEFAKHTTDEHGIEYSKEVLMKFILRKG
jgi:predicted small metal-binding protein